ncbi:hypothetical protein IMZ31_20695 (plasmid) [Pontibacillus sp. ALD_SL1]|uniref:hypothetical protein n=1 Tax=Pontibacillus sp. ALD_SL1 TaxID=2777185 RepID=UPI001A97C473|nr:hypothetical protein [Pontibacillus sp. ALD_SL1]QST02968.1 hypothetical protein IMZ31_20695 [Pontibacillus sp. ALD_SL1]
MFKVENIGSDRIRFTSASPSVVEVMLVDGKMFVHSEPIKAKAQAPVSPQAQPATKDEKVS